MAYLVRKITRSKWPEEIIPVEEMPADVITSDLRTSQNTLSFWRIEKIEDLEIAALALAASSKSTSIEKIAIVYIPEEEILAASIAVENSLGDTVVPDLAALHRDLSSLTLGSLKKVSELINRNMHQSHYKCYTRKAVQVLIGKAYQEKRVCEEKCDTKLYQEISKIAVS